MNLLSIIVEEDLEFLKEKLNKQIQSFINEDIQLEENIINVDSAFNISYSVKIESIKNYPVSDFVNLFKYCIANALWEYIQHHEEPKLIKKILDDEFYYFEVAERAEIERIAIDILNSDNDVDVAINGDKFSRKAKIIKDLLEYFRDSNEIHLKGFITFRLKDYFIDLEDTLERAIEDFLMDREYNEFIKLLKYFVDIQESKIDLVHVVMDEEDHKYKLYDNHNKPIDNNCFNEIAKELTDYNHLTYEDILISTLITMAPSIIYIHKVSSIQQPEMIKTIAKVFTTKVKLCNGCDWCNINSKVKNNE
ncbi:putative sporulation protein YtxC [Alkaliphilus serpentinus]|uniref:Putative sporulation protein YtxC n=1 Tax=Alkaliphilus serpentinus TaxID=1482731 RepID=A0A833HNM5_9FIRM|nr:putative sporulation protein YtxC [Alkaliphilus serpentinus]KAB3529823.1 putative sporulation protein YtxC [Alkaliphilus serpentinus]